MFERGSKMTVLKIALVPLWAFAPAIVVAVLLQSFGLHAIGSLVGIVCWWGFLFWFLSKADHPSAAGRSFAKAMDWFTTYD